MLFTRREWIPLDSTHYVLGRIYMFCIALFVSLPYLDCSISCLLSDIYVYIICVVVYFPQVPPSKTRERQNDSLAKAAHHRENESVGQSMFSLTTSGPSPRSSLPGMASLKRKAINQGDDDQDRPRNSLLSKNRLQHHNSRFVHRRLPPISTRNPANPPLQPRNHLQRQRLVLSGLSSGQRVHRNQTCSRLGTSTTRPPDPSRDVTVRSVSSTYTRTKAPPPTRRTQVVMIEFARAADAARLAADMESERARLLELRSRTGCYSG